LTGCTRIEVAYFPSTVRALGFLGPSDILDPDETLYLESLKTIVVDNPSQIEILARALRAGSYAGSGGRLLMDRYADITCYRGEERMISLEDYGSWIYTEDGHAFRYDSAPIRLRDVAPQIYPFYLRRRCATLLYRIGVDFALMTDGGDAWPAPYEWTDRIFRQRIAERGTGNPRALEYIAEQFVCPSAGHGRCHYAMNPACEPNSPPDTVLLFETKAGWNQHGGSELFTFDNHDPKGGCVLLKGEEWPTVKFVRTEQELYALRWK